MYYVNGLEHQYYQNVNHFGSMWYMWYSIQCDTPPTMSKFSVSIKVYTIKSLETCFANLVTLKENLKQWHERCAPFWTAITDCISVFRIPNGVKYIWSVSRNRNTKILFWFTKYESSPPNMTLNIHSKKRHSDFLKILSLMNIDNATAVVLRLCISKC